MKEKIRFLGRPFPLNDIDSCRVYVSICEWRDKNKCTTRFVLVASETLIHQYQLSMIIISINLPSPRYPYTVERD